MIQIAQDKYIILFDGMGCIFKVPKKLSNHFLEKFQKEQVFEYRTKNLIYKSVEVQEPIACFKIVKEDAQYTYFQTSTYYGRQVYQANKEIIKKYDATYFNQLDNFNNFIKREPNLNHPRAHKEQPQVFSKSYERLLKTGLCFVKAGTGCGKSVIILKTATMLKTRTLILVHREKLVKHFEEECFNILGITPSNLGKIHRGTKNLTSPIVIGTIQSVLSIIKTNPNAFKDLFGFIAYDEADIMGAREFSKVLRAFNPKYQMGCSATIKRSDGMEDVFWSHFGKENVVEAKGDALPIKVVVQETQTYLPTYYKNKPNLVNTGLALNKAYNQTMAKLGFDLYKKGRNVLVFAENTYHLALYKKYLLDLGVPQNEIGEFFGTTDSSSRHMTDDLRRYILPANEKTDKYFEWVKKQPKFVLATFAYMDRGISIPRLDTGISLVDRSDMTQTIGRIRRPAELGTVKALPVWIFAKHTNIPILSRRTEKFIKELQKDKNIMIRRLTRL